MTDMSMISAQIDELRELAGDGSMEWVTGPIRASVLRDAADTIWQLRDDLQRTNAENAKLRELVADMWHEGMCECGSRGKCASCEYDYPTRMRELGVEVD